MTTFMIVSFLLRQSLQPPEAVFGATARTVFATDPAVVSEFVEQAKQVAVVHLAVIRLVARGYARNLDMADTVDMLAEGRCQIALDNLRVIKIHLHLDVGLAHRRA